MDIDQIRGRLDFLREAERLKSVLRSAHTASGRTESTAEHSWRLCLMAMAFEDELADLDLLKVLKMCVVHDLGEAIHGDIPAIEQGAHPNKSAQEREDLQLLTRTLDAPLRAGILALWDEYEKAETPEAQAVKALDKLETLLQHNQGANPPDFDYEFNLGYGQKHTGSRPLFRAMRALVDADTQKKVEAARRTEAGPVVRPEQPGDEAAIRQLTVAAFAGAAHADGTEHLIVDALRAAGQLTLSLVVEDGGEIVGHVALSPVAISDGTTGWHGLGPISVAPARQGQGIGRLLMDAALAGLRDAGAQGCVLLGDPAFYGRFGFVARPGLVLPGVPPEYFQAVSFHGAWPVGDVRYHAAFGVGA